MSDGPEVGVSLTGNQEYRKWQSSKEPYLDVPFPLADTWASRPVAPAPRGFFGRKPRKFSLLMTNMPGAGGTSLFYKMKNQQVVWTFPNAAYYADEFEYSPENDAKAAVDLQITQFSLDEKSAYFFPHLSYFKSGVIFVVDSSTSPEDQSRAGLALRLLCDNLKSQGGIPVPVLVIANKQDKPSSVSPEECVQHMGLTQLRNPWYIHGTSCTRDFRFMDGINWLVHAMVALETKCGSAFVTSGMKQFDFLKTSGLVTAPVDPLSIPVAPQQRSGGPPFFVGQNSPPVRTVSPPRNLGEPAGGSSSTESDTRAGSASQATTQVSSISTQECRELV